MTRWHRNSDYGAVLADVVENHLDLIGHRTAVLVLGDARSNHTDPQLDLLREIASRARHVSWLNPEPARMWGSGDSVALRYSEIVDMHEIAFQGSLLGVEEERARVRADADGSGLAVVVDGEAPFTLWNARAFVLEKP